MRYNVAGLLKSPTGEARQVAVDGVVRVDDPAVRVVGPVRGRLRLTREPDGVLVAGRLETLLSTDCRRCLSPIETTLALEIEESFRPTVAIPGGPPAAGVDADDVDDATLIDDLHVLDITEVVRQSILVAAPLGVVCRTECEGLCPVCGQDRNAGSCTCAPAPDPRWDALRALLEQEESEGRTARDVD